MGMYGYPQDFPGVTKLINNYIAEIRENVNFRKTSRKEKMVVAFAQTRDKEIS